MANKYWAAGVSGNWNSITSWSDFATGTPAGALVPGAGDAAIFNAASGTVTATLDISPTVQTLTMTGFTGTLAFGANTISLNSTGTIFTGATTMTVTGTPQIICTNSSASARTFTPTAVTEANSISFRFTAGTGTITNTSGGAIRDLDFTDGVNPTGYAGAFSALGITVYGSLKASTGMTQTSGTGTITFAATSGTKTIDTAGVTFDRPFTFNGVGGTFQLASALTSGATRTCTLTNGTLDLASYTLTTGLFSSSNSNTRVIAFGTGSITITCTNTTALAMGTVTNFSYTGTPTLNFTGVGTALETRVISFGGTAGATENKAVDINISAGSDTITTPSGCVVRNINYTGFSGTSNFFAVIYGNVTLSSSVGFSLINNSAAATFAATSGTKTITSNGKTIDAAITFNGIGGTFACQDALTLGSTRALTLTNGTLQLKAGTTNTVGSIATSGTNQKFLQSTTPGTQATLSDASGTNSVSYLTIQDSNATGGAIFDATDATNVNAGNNLGWDFSDVAVGGSGNTIGFGFGFRI